MLQNASQQMVSRQTSIVKRPLPNASPNLPPKNSTQRLHNKSSTLQYWFDYNTNITNNIHNLSEAPRANCQPIGFTNKAFKDRIHAGVADKDCFASSLCGPSAFDDDDRVPIDAVGMDDTLVCISDHHISSSQMLQTASHDKICVNRSLFARC
jgi:hypothetical protein